MLVLSAACSQSRGDAIDAVATPDADDTASSSTDSADSAAVDTAEDPDAPGPEPDLATTDSASQPDTGDGSGGDIGTDSESDTIESPDTAESSDTVDVEPDDADGTDSVSDSEDDTGSSGVGAELGVLFVGNSYIYTNDLPTVFGALAAEAGFGPGALRIDSVTAGGYRLEQHAADYRAGARIATAMQAEAAVAWDAVVLQEQSQIPGFPVGVAERDRSMVAVVELAGYANAVGAATVLFHTWGYRVGAARNSHIFPDYPTMQTRLTSGYSDMGAAVSTAAYDVTIAEVGEAYRLVWNAAASAGGDAASERLFTSLYSGDNSHPDRAGTYLAACVLLARIAGVDVRTLDTYNAGLPAADRDLLQSYAMQVVSGAP